VSGPSRIIVYGVTGSGKSTLAPQIAERTGLPLHSVDDLMWLPGWVEVAPDEQRRLITAICAGDRWVIDSAYGKWVDVPLARADLVVGLDYPRWLSLTRLMRRTFLRATFKPRVCNGNTETWRQVLSRDSIISWHFRSFERKRSRIRAWEADPAKPPVVRLTSARATRRWLDGLGRAAGL
jgi:adenylate kinase family enzyme